MIKKILLIHPSYLSNIKSMPLGIAYLKSFLQKYGYDVKMIDIDPAGLTFRDLCGVLNDFAPDVVGISFMTVQANSAQAVAAVVKSFSSGIITVAGGIHASAIPKETLDQGNFDFVICGEGEGTFKELLDCLKSDKKDLRLVKGLAFKENGKVIVNEARELLGDIDHLPFPDWNDLSLKGYTNSILGVRDNGPVFPILSTRGCPHNCIFCASNVIFKRKYRARSAKNIMKEIVYLIGRYGAKNFDFVDDTVSVDRNRLIELCDLIIAERLGINWLCNARVDGFDEKLAFKLKSAGCRDVCFGVESGDPEVWKAINKNITREQILNAHSAAKKSGLIVTSFFMVGNMGESKESVKKTILFINEITTDCPTCSIATPYPGTKMYEIGKRNNWIKTENWDEYTTTPHIKMDYKPVWTNGIMSGEEILDAYYYVNSRIMIKKLVTRYGRFYYLNPEFYLHEVFKRIRKKGMKNFTKMVWKLCRA